MDAGKKIKDRKRHILVDTLGLLLKAKVLTADVQDRDGVKLLLLEIKEQITASAIDLGGRRLSRKADFMGRRAVFMDA